MGIAVTLGTLWCNGSTLARNARDVGFYSHSRCNITHFHHTHDTGAADQDPVKPWLFNLPCVCIRKVIACMYVIVSIKILTIPRDEGSSLH